MERPIQFWRNTEERPSKSASSVHEVVGATTPKDRPLSLKFLSWTEAECQVHARGLPTVLITMRNDSLFSRDCMVQGNYYHLIFYAAALYLQISAMLMLLKNLILQKNLEAQQKCTGDPTLGLDP